MNISTGLVRKMEDFDPKMKDILFCFMDEIEEKTSIIAVGRCDFDELKNVIRQLAEAQNRTEHRVEELAESQNRTEHRLEELAVAQRELAVAQILSSGDKMATTADIKQLSDTIAREFHPKKIVLFGSHAWGIPTSDSDVDILVILPFEGKNWRMASTIRERVHPAFPLDLLVRTESQINERLNHHDTFFTEVMVKGRVLHES